MQETARRWCREAYFSTEQSEACPQARFSCPDRIPRWTGRPSFSPGQGPASSECVISSIARRRTFTELRRVGRRARAGSVRLSFLPLDVETPQVAFAIGRSFGNAVERNRGRRRLKAAFVEAAFGPQDHARHMTSTPTPGNSTHAVDNLLIVGGRSPVEALDRSGNLGDLHGAFLLTGSRGLLTAPYLDLVDDVASCFRKLRSVPG